MFIRRIKSKIKRLPILQRREKVKAIYENDLIPVLSKLELYDKIIHEEIKCIVCDEVITIENLGVILKEENEYRIICLNPECISKIQN